MAGDQGKGRAAAFAAFFLFGVAVGVAGTVIYDRGGVRLIFGSDQPDPAAAAEAFCDRIATVDKLVTRCLADSRGEISLSLDLDLSNDLAAVSGLGASHKALCVEIRAAPPRLRVYDVGNRPLSVCEAGR